MIKHWHLLNLLALVLPAWSSRAYAADVIPAAPLQLTGTIILRESGTADNDAGLPDDRYDEKFTLSNLIYRKTNLKRNGDDVYDIVGGQWQYEKTYHDYYRAYVARHTYCTAHKSNKANAKGAFSSRSSALSRLNHLYLNKATGKWALDIGLPYVKFESTTVYECDKKSESRPFSEAPQFGSSSYQARAQAQNRIVTLDFGQIRVEGDSWRASDHRRRWDKANRVWSGKLTGPFLPDLSAWQSLISFRPSEATQRNLLARGFLIPWRVQRIEDAFSANPINLDYYPVSVTKLPVRDGSRMRAEELLLYIRTNLTGFVDSNISEFEPYDDPVPDGNRWRSLNPLNAVIHIDIYALGGWFPADDASVVVAQATSRNWIFSTIYTEGDLQHPVSGNRQFGVNAQSDGSFIFYTRGADRPTDSGFDYLFSNMGFAGADALWKSFQQRIVQFVNHNGGAATALPPTSERYPWEPVRLQYHRPTARWVDR